MTFGEKLRAFRKEKKMTQAELAEKMGCGINTIINYENGKTYPNRRDVYVKLGEVLGVDANYLHNENEDFIDAAAKKYGPKGKEQAAQLIEDAKGLFAGGELSDNEKLGVLKALQEAFWECKDLENEKGSRKKG